MRSERFHSKTEKAVPIVVDEASRLTVSGTDQVNVYQVDDQGKKVKLLTKGTDFKVKLNDVEEVLLESKGDFQSVIEGPDPLDTTPLEVAVEKPLTQTQQLKMWLQNENNIQQLAKAELTWEDFKDLGDMDDGDEFYSQLGQSGMTKYEMQAEMLRQHANPNRGMNLEDVANVEGAAKKDVNIDPGSSSAGPGGQTNDSGKSEGKASAGEAGGQASEG